MAVQTDPVKPPVPSTSPSALGRLGRWCATHPWRLVAAWIVVLTVATLANHAFGGIYSDNFTLPNSPSEQGAAVLRAHDRGAGGQGGELVFSVGAGRLGSDRAVIERSVADVRRVPHVLAVSDPLSGRTVSANGRTAVATVHFDTNPGRLGRGYVARIDRAVTPARHAGVTVNYGGALGQAAAPKGKDGRSAFIGIAVALIVLLAGFGSVFAAGLPLVSAGLATLSGLGILGLVAATSTFPTVSPTFAVMMGLGVGIDYALFLSTRHRQQLMEGVTPGDAASHTLATSGRAVVVAATTVTVALLALYVSGIGFLGELGLAGAIAVAVGALGALTLVPALFGLLGRRIDRYRVRKPVAEAAPGGAGWGRYARLVGAHPWRYLLGALAVLCVLAVPVLSMRLGHVDAGADAAGSTGKQAYDEITAAFGSGANSPFTIAVSLPARISAVETQALEAKLHRALTATPDVSEVGPVQPNASGDVLVATLIPRSNPQQPATETLQATLRDTTLPDALAGTGAKGYVTGTASEQLDFTNQITSRLPLVVLAVVAIAFLLLLVNFRSPILAAKAAVLNLLSIGAAYGVIVAVFQWGWGGSIFGISEKVPIESYVPMVMFTVVFGLSMDYEVFLLSRVREAWARTGDNHQAVAAGLAATGRVITCAAAIMTGVFLAFLLSTNVVIKMLALGLGVSVLIDATLIRLIVVPAAMFLLGRANWWTPRWLDWLLPGGNRSRPAQPDPAPVPVPVEPAGARATAGSDGSARRGNDTPSRHRIATLGAAVLAVAVLAAFLLTVLGTSGPQGQTKAKGRLQGAIAATVGADRVSDRTLTSQLTLTGTVGSPNGAVSITAQTPGTVTSLSISAGQTVTAGQVVAKLSDTQGLGAKQAAAEAQLAQAQSALAQAQSPRPQPSNVIAADQAAVNAAQDNLDAANQALAQLTVTSPIAGTVAQILVPVGGYAGPANPIATLAGSTETVTVQASPLQVSTLEHRTGAHAAVSLAVPDPTTQVSATLTAIGASADAATQQTPVTFAVDGSLEPNAPVTVTVELPQPPGPAVPGDAVVTVNGRRGVYVLTGILHPTSLGIKLPANVPTGTEVGRATFTPVTTGITEQGTTQVLAGLTAGETVVTTGQSDLTTLRGSQEVAILPTGQSGRASPATGHTKRASPARTSPASRAPKSGQGNRGGIDVTVVAVHGSRLTVSTPIGKRTFTVPAGFRITHDGKPVALNQLRAGDLLKVTFAKVNGKRVPASAVLQ